MMSHLLVLSTNGNSLGVLSADSLYLWDFDGSYSLVSGNDTTSDVGVT